ncbi:hypothetical protein Tco_1338151 [Tanacetum coccineum]
METRKWSVELTKEEANFITAIEKRLPDQKDLSIVDIEQVAVSSSLRLLEPKCTIESRAKRSSINLVRTRYLKDGDGERKSQTPQNQDVSDFEAPLARCFCPPITRASHP